MTEVEFEDYLLSLFDNLNDFDDTLDGYLWDEPEVKYSRTYDDASLLTRNKGLVVTLRDGSSFDLTIVKRS